jgi:signal transduction histidine kinase
LNLVLEASNRQLSELDIMKDNFLSMVSHDLRTPLTGIQAYAEIVRHRRHLLLPADQDKFLDIIIEQSKRLGRLINDLLDVQRFETRFIKLEFKDLDLVPLLREAVDAFRGAAREKNLSLKEDFPDREIMVRGHRDRLHQAMANLLSNAVKFTPDHGRIQASAHTQMNGTRPAVVVEVKDNGPGVPPEMQNRVFEKFQQADKLVRDKMQGSGLGLALMRDIIELHGGEVGVSSSPGQGSTFYFTLPLIA